MPARRLKPRQHTPCVEQLLAQCGCSMICEHQQHRCLMLWHGSRPLPRWESIPTAAQIAPPQRWRSFDRIWVIMRYDVTAMPPPALETDVSFAGRPPGDAEV